MSSSDPLPYTQVDRAVKPKATLLAGAISVSPQHALGSLVEFWDLCGDPREIERLIASGKNEIWLTRDEVSARFEVASGKSLEPERLCLIGILEKRDNLFRVRGMSRYFAPIRGRLSAREKGRAGGLASAKARAEKYGTSQPMAPEPPLESAQAPAQAPAQAGPKPARSSAEAGLEAETEAAPKPPEAADIGHRTSVNKLPLPHENPVVVVVADQNRPPEAAAELEKLWAWMGDVRRELDISVEREPPGKLLDWLLARKAEGRTESEIGGAYVLFLRDEDFRAKGWPTAVFISDKIWPPRMRVARPPRGMRL